MIDVTAIASPSPGMNRLAPSSRTLVPWIVFALGLFLHALPARHLGLLWDDGNHFVQGLHAAEGDALRFVLSDTWAMLPGERPLDYPVSLLARLCFLAGLPALHLFTAGLFSLGAALLAAVARRLCDRKGFALASGVLFLVLPLSPLQAIWPSTAQYSAALLLVFSATLAATRPASGKAWTILAVTLNGLALVTLESVALIGPALLAAALLAPRLGLARREEGASRRARVCLAAFLAEIPLYALWRLYLLPLYGTITYGRVPMPSPLMAGQRFVLGLQLSLWPWRRASSEHFLLAPSRPWDLLVALTAAVAAAILLVASQPGPAETLETPETPAGRPSLARAPRALLAAAPGLLVFLAGLFPLVLVPGAFRAIAGLFGRLNFTLLPGVALIYAALVSLPFALPGRRARAALAAVLLFVVAFEGARFHLAVKQAYVADGEQMAAVFRQLPAVAPALAPGTFVVLDTDWHEPVGQSRGFGMSYWELSGYLMAFYDDWSVQGCVLDELRPSRHGIRPLLYGRAATWFPPGRRGLVCADANVTIPPVGWDRLVLLRFDGGRLAAVPRMRFWRQDRWVTFRSNPGRILATPRKPSPAWCHVLPESCAQPAARPEPPGDDDEAAEVLASPPGDDRR